MIEKWSSGSPSEPLKWKKRPVSASSACSSRASSPVNHAVTRELSRTR